MWCKAENCSQILEEAKQLLDNKAQKKKIILKRRKQRKKRNVTLEFV